MINTPMCKINMFISIFTSHYFKITINTGSLTNPDLSAIKSFGLSGSAGAAIKQWYPQFELDFKKGMGKAVFSGKERPVLAQTFSSVQQYIFQFSWQDILEPQLAITYESRTGISHNEKSINSIWKTSCLANRRIYIGNLKTYYEDGSSKIFPDKMVRSLPNKFDIFPISESVDVAINDGDDIVKLEAFGDRILQF